MKYACCAAVFTVATFASVSQAADEIEYFGYTKAIELKNDSTRVVLCPQAGGRVLEYSIRGKNVLYLSPAEKEWTPGSKSIASAGRFDIGPELVVPSRHVLWSGEWEGKITGEHSARLTSQVDKSTGVQLVRDFKLSPDSSRLICTQTIVNKLRDVSEWCHWSRTFAVGKGIAVVFLNTTAAGPISRFPNKYVMYEEGRLINMQPDDPQIREVDNALLIYPTPRKPKLGFDSYAGSLAYLAPNDLLFVKRFNTYPNRVYNEAAGLTISVWYPDSNMVELEPIGPRERLKRGESASFTEEWHLVEQKFPGPEGDVDVPSLRTTVDGLESSDQLRK